MSKQASYTRENDEVVLINGKYYRLMTDAECAQHIWGQKCPHNNLTFDTQGLRCADCGAVLSTQSVYVTCSVGNS